jgi:hypothetical protein
MLTAYGLALQAAGKAKYSINLTPASKHGSWLGRIPKLRSQKGPLVCWGVDVGSHALKAVQLKVDDEDIEVAQVVVLCQEVV